MAHPVGERLVCDECGAEIMFVRECPCPEHEPKTHATICCGEAMRSLGVQETQATQPEAGPGA